MQNQQKREQKGIDRTDFHSPLILPVVVAAPTVLGWPLLDECFSAASGYLLVRSHPQPEAVQFACLPFHTCVLIVDWDFVESGLWRSVRLGSGVHTLIAPRTSKRPEDDLERLLCDGCVGFLSEIRKDEMQRATRAVASGELWVSRQLLAVLLKKLIVQCCHDLTTREAEILNLKRAGTSNSGIANRLCISRETVRWHIRQLNQKLTAQPRQGCSRFPPAKQTGEPLDGYRVEVVREYA